MKEGKISDQDYLIISDVDEIPNEEKLEERLNVFGLLLELDDGDE